MLFVQDKVKEYSLNNVNNNKMVRVSVLKDYCLISMNLLAQPHEDFRGVSCVLPTVSFQSFLDSLLEQ